MLKKAIKVLFLLSGVLFISACDNKGSQHQAENQSQSKSGEKSVLIECKAIQTEGSKFFNATIEIFHMTDEVLDKVHKTPIIQDEFTKSDVPIYARVKNIELIGKKSSRKDSCIESTPFYGEIPFEKLSHNGFRLYPSIEGCKYGFSIALDAGDGISLLETYKNDLATGAPFTSSCHIVRR